jgi:hypothetical protein
VPRDDVKLTRIAETLAGADTLLRQR